MEVSRVLQNLGLSKKETNVYIALLGIGNGTVGSISRKIHSNKDDTYNILTTLLRKGIITTKESQGRVYFNALNPRKLIENFEIQLEKAKLILPELAALDNLNIVKPRITYYEGKEGLISIMEDTLTAQGEILCWADVSVALEALSEYYPTYVKNKNILNIFVRGIFTDDPRSIYFKQRGDIEKREVRIISKEKFPFKNEINIYNDSVAIIAHREMMGVIIQSKDIAETQRSIFKFGWEYAGILDKLRTKELKYN